MAMLATKNKNFVKNPFNRIHILLIEFVARFEIRHFEDGESFGIIVGNIALLAETDVDDGD